MLAKEGIVPRLHVQGNHSGARLIDRRVNSIKDRPNIQVSFVFSLARNMGGNDGGCTYEMIGGASLRSASASLTTTSGARVRAAEHGFDRKVRPRRRARDSLPQCLQFLMKVGSLYS